MVFTKILLNKSSFESVWPRRIQFHKQKEKNWTFFYCDALQWSIKFYMWLMNALSRLRSHEDLWKIFDAGLWSFLFDFISRAVNVDKVLFLNFSFPNSSVKYTTLSLHVRTWVNVCVIVFSLAELRSKCRGRKICCVREAKCFWLDWKTLPCFTDAKFARTTIFLTYWLSWETFLSSACFTETMGRLY